MLSIILTLDYEIFGNGTGDVHCCMIEPTARLLDVCDDYGAKLTIFFEMGHYWALKDSIRQNRGPIDARIQVNLIEAQLSDAVARGHDVQFHLHSQWLDWKFLDGRWHLNLDMLRLPMVFQSRSVPLEYASFQEIFHRAKSDLEHLLKEAEEEYECFAFRAGYLSIQPSYEIMKAATSVGFFCDSSVLPGMREVRAPVYYEFEKCERQPFWRCDPDALWKNVEAGALLELPIANVELSFVSRILLKLEKGTKSVAKTEHRCNGFPIPLESSGTTLRSGITEKIASKRYVLDFAETPPSKLVHLFKKYIRTQRTYDLIPIVLLGHSKSVVSMDFLDGFLDELCSRRVFYGHTLRFDTVRSFFKGYQTTFVGS